MEENNPKEINLIQLISLLFQWLKKATLTVYKITGNILQLAYKHKWIVIIITALFIIGGQYFARPSARVYNAEAMAMIYGPDDQTVKEICKQLVNSSQRVNDLTLATKLGIPDSVSKNIVSVKTFGVIDFLKDKTADKIDFKNNHSLEDTMNIRMEDRIYIQIKTKNISQIPTFQAALNKYFDENPILKSKFEAGRNNYLDRINICNIELQRIDSLAKVFYFKDVNDQIKFENNKLIVGENKKQLFTEELIRINYIKGEAQSKLAEYIRPVNFPSDFVVSPIPENGRVKYGVLSIIYGLILSLIIIVIVDNFKRFIAFLENK